MRPTFMLMVVLTLSLALGIPEPRGCDRFSFEYQLMERLIKMELENSNLRERVANLEKANSSRQVAFNVGLVDNQDVSQNEGNRIMYNLESLNMGDSFDLVKSEFVAPVSGLYMFSVTLCLYSPDKWMDLDIINDGAVVGRLFGGNARYHTSSSTAFLAHLDRGNTVWVMKAMGTTSDLNEGHGKNTFVGALIMPD